MTARTLNEVQKTPGSNFAYFGDRGDWPVAYAVHRDSDVLERANYAAMLKLLAECDSDDYAEETASHWAVGHVSHILVRPGTEAEEIAIKAQEALEDYPVIDDEELSNLEYEEALQAAAMGFSDYGYGRMNSDPANVAPFILEAAGDTAHNMGLENWYPSQQDVFRGVLAYRRYVRSQGK